MYSVVAATALLGPVAAVVVPLPVLYFYSRFGRASGLMYFALSLIIVGGVLKALDSPIAVGYFITFGSLGLILSEVLRRDFSIEKTLIVTTAVVLMVTALMLVFYGMRSGQAPWNAVSDYIAGMIRHNMDLFAESGASGQQIELLRNREERMVSLLTAMAPSLLIAGTAFIVWLATVSGSILFQARRMWYPAFGNLRLWKLPDRFLWGVALVLLCLLLPLEFLLIVGLNGLVVVVFLYMLQGFSVLGYFFEAKNIHRFLRIALFAFIVVQQVLILPVAILGFVDALVDFRKTGGGNMPPEATP